MSDLVARLCDYCTPVARLCDYCTPEPAAAQDQGADMSDLVAKLRDFRERFIFQGSSKFATDIADEIERLTAELASEKDEVFRLQCSHSKLYNERDALRKDAERYRWLRDCDTDPVCSLPQLFTETGDSQDVDAAIDAAMSSAQSAAG